jgi:hypothetical protein
VPEAHATQPRPDADGRRGLAAREREERAGAVGHALDQSPVARGRLEDALIRRA